MRYLRLILAFVMYVFTPLVAQIDLETLAQDFVLETKQLSIPGHPHACNPSIVRWQNQLILSFDAYVDRDDQPDAFGLACLDDEFNVLGKPQILDLPANLWQDPRLITLNERLYAVFNGAIEDGIRRMFIGELHRDTNAFKMANVTPLLDFPGEKPDLWERNWVPFVSNETLLLTYSLSPHRILQPIAASSRCEEMAATPTNHSWTWGTPKPGTAALRQGDHYLAFFHSIKVMPSVHSDAKPIQHYFMGAYTFDTAPPFAVRSMSTTPIVGQGFYHGPEYPMIKPCRVVFPGGFVMDEQCIWIAYGRQDHEVWIVKLDKQGLYETLESANFQPIP